MLTATLPTHSPYSADDKCACGAVVDLASPVLMHRLRSPDGQRFIRVVRCPACPKDAT